jgi:hypothetical protein
MSKVNIIRFPAVEDDVRIYLMNAIRITGPTVLEQVAFCKKRFLKTLLWMVFCLNVAPICNERNRSIPFTDDREREVIFFTNNW